MKKLLFIFLAGVNFLLSHAQVTYHFPHHNAVWGQAEVVCCFGINGNESTGYTSFLTADGDTTFNGNTYIKVVNASDSTGNMIIDQWPRFIREDSTAKVFEGRVYDSIEYLLYDFNANAGDTIYVGYDSCMIFVDSVSEIQTVIEIRKALYVHSKDYECTPASGDSLIWIEGIGSTAGLFYPTGGIGVDGFLHLTCFTENDTMKYGTICNEFYTGIPDIHDDLFSISPNPSQGEFKIMQTLNGNRILGVKVCNALGEQVLSIYEPNMDQPITLNLYGLSNGIYFVQIQTSNEGVTKKLILSKP